MKTRDRKRRPFFFRKKCVACNIGFNRTSSFVICSLCDKLQHVRCIRREYEDNNFQCQKCKKVPAPSSNQASSLVQGQSLVPSQLPVQNIVQETDPIIMNQHQDILSKHIAESGLPYEPSTLTRSVIMIVISVHPTVLLAS